MLFRLPICLFFLPCGFVLAENLSVFGTFDFNQNRKSEIFKLNGLLAPLELVELDQEGNHETLWSYSPDDGSIIVDAKFSDLNQDKIPELIVAHHGADRNDWLSVFEWNGKGFIKNKEKIITTKIIEFEKTFTRFMDDDLNISGSLASLFDFIREMNIFIDKKEMSYSNLRKSKELIERINTVIDVLETKSEKDKMINEITNLNFNKLLEERDKARKEKDWITADKIRKNIRKAGYDIEDTESGARIIRIKRNTE